MFAMNKANTLFFPPCNKKGASFYTTIQNVVDRYRKLPFRYPKKNIYPYILIVIISLCKKSDAINGYRLQPCVS